MSNNLAIIINPCSISYNGRFNNSNALTSVSKSDIKKLIDFYQKSIKIAIKSDKVKIAIGNVVLNSLSIVSNDSIMNVQKTYVATVNKKYIKQAIDFYKNISNLNLLIDKINKKNIENNDFFKEMTAFENNDIVLPSPATLQNDLDNTPLKNSDIGVNEFSGSVDFSDIKSMPSEIVENQLSPSQPLNQELIKSNNNIPVFNSGMEGNLNNVLNNNEENISYDTSKINLNNIPSQTIDKTIAENDLGNSGHIKGKLVAFLVVVLFVASCIFLGYEITKISDVMPLIKDKYFS